MAAKFASAEVWIMVDENGDFGVGTDQEQADAHYEEHIQERTAAGGIRYVRVTVKVPLPETIEISAEVPDTEGDPVVMVA